MNYTAELQAKATDNAAFDELIAQLRADRAVRQPEMREIAIAFIGYRIANSTPRPKALQKIIMDDSKGRDL